MRGFVTSKSVWNLVGIGIGLMLTLAPSVVWLPLMATNLLRIIGLPLCLYSGYRFGDTTKLLIGRWSVFGKLLVISSATASLFLFGDIFLGRTSGMGGAIIFIVFLVPGILCAGAVGANAWFKIWPIFYALGAVLAIFKTPSSLGLIDLGKSDPGTFASWMMRVNTSADSDLSYIWMSLGAFVGLLIDLFIKAAFSRRASTEVQARF